MKQKRKQLPEKQKPANGKLLQWHPAFYADLQIEFREETEEDKIVKSCCYVQQLSLKSKLFQ